MPDFRTQPSIGERNDLLWFRRAVPLRRWYAYLSALAILTAALALIGWTLAGDRRVYWSAPVSSSHVSFQQDCKQCHVQNFAPAMRLAKLDDDHFSVRDQDCQACHRQSSHDHHPSRMQKELVSGCVECHREHVDKSKLADVADLHCTQCHSDLKSTDGAHEFAQHVTSFDQHPEFFLWEQKELLRKPTTMLPVSRDRDTGGWRDRTELKFNHAKHLVDVGVLVPPTPGITAISHKDRRILDCNDCHVPDAAGAYMQPINYEQHCAACHHLPSKTSLLVVGGPLPHESPAIVLGLLRDRLMKYANENPDFDKTSEDVPRLPNKEPRSAKDKWTWVEDQLDEARGNMFKIVKDDCIYCHTPVTGAFGQHDLAFEIIPPRIPERWLAGSRFDHAKHREVSCVACHDPDHGEAHVTKLGLKTKLASELSADILMPKLQSCRACHGERPTNGRSPGARARCVDCHDYHDPHTPAAGKLDAWLKRAK